MKYSRKVMSVLLALVLTVALTACGGSGNQTGGGAPAQQGGSPAAGAKVRTIFGTGNSGGVYYILGAGIAELINTQSDSLEVTAQSTSGATENLNLVNAGEIQFGFTVYDVAYYATIGEREYEGMDKMENLRLLMMGHVGTHATVVWADSPYQSMGDLAGETIPTSPGVAAYLLDYNSFKPWGIEMEENKSPVLSYNDQATAMKDGTIVCSNFNMAHPASAIMDMASTRPIRILSQTDETMAQIVAEHPYWRPSVIPRGTYTGQEEDAMGIGFPYAIVVNKDVPDEAVREFLQICLDNDLTAIHPDGAFYTADNEAYGDTPMFPYHPAAEAYLQEIGAIS